jgi:hypothetical protein
MMAWKQAHPSTVFDLSPSWFTAAVPGHDEPFTALTLSRLMDKLENFEKQA